MDYRHYWINRVGLTLVVATTGCLSAGSAEAAGHGRGSVGHWQPQGPIFKTLDAVAGGIESVLQRTVLARRGSSACDSIGCDDHCDSVTLQHFEHLSTPASAYGHAPSPPSAGLPLKSQAAPKADASPRNQPLRNVPSAPSSPSLPRSQPTPSVPSPARPLPRVPADQHSERSALSTEDGWIDSFSPSQPISRNARPRPMAPQGQQRSDALPNPFMDDPQSTP